MTDEALSVAQLQRTCSITSSEFRARSTPRFMNLPAPLLRSMSRLCSACYLSDAAPAPAPTTICVRMGVCVAFSRASFVHPFRIALDRL